MWAESEGQVVVGNLVAMIRRINSQKCTGTNTGGY